MRRSTLLHTCIWLALPACKSRPTPEPALVGETRVQAAPHSTSPFSEPAPPTTSAGIDPRLPVIGDPLGLLSKPPAEAVAGRANTGGAQLDPGALMAGIPVENPSVVQFERDPRAVARGQPIEAAPVRSPRVAQGAVRVQEKSARDVVRRATQGGARAHVLFLYASYCKACRQVMPSFVELVRSYKGRGVAFTAASLDVDQDAFAAYAGVLQGSLEPFWIRPDGTTRLELKRAGIRLANDSLPIPFFAVFAGQNRLIAQGNTRELRDLPRTLDALL